MTHGCAVGVDIERARPNVAFDDLIISRCFSLAEQRALAELPLAFRAAAFYRCWTCKEAYIKGRGDGLNVPLVDFDVAVDPRRPAALARPYVSEDANWTLHAIDLGDEYAGALAVRDPEAEPIVRAWAHVAKDGTSFHRTSPVQSAWA